MNSLVPPALAKPALPRTSAPRPPSASGPRKPPWASPVPISAHGRAPPMTTRRLRPRRRRILRSGWPRAPRRPGKPAGLRAPAQRPATRALPPASSAPHHSAPAEREAGKATESPVSPAEGPAPAELPEPPRKQASPLASAAVPTGATALPAPTPPLPPGLPIAAFAAAIPGSPADSLAETARPGGAAKRADALAKMGGLGAPAAAPLAGAKSSAIPTVPALKPSAAAASPPAASAAGAERPQLSPASLETPVEQPDAAPGAPTKAGVAAIAPESGPAPNAMHSDAGEKIAVNAQIQPALGISDKSARDKNSLSSKDKQDTQQVNDLGMAGAKNLPTMSAPAFAHAHPAEIAPTSGLPMTAAPAATAVAGAPAGPGAASAAREAVEQVIKLADAQASQAEHGVQAVNFGIKFGDSTLGVRVALQGGSVHTQFNTDSPEASLRPGGRVAHASGGVPQPDLPVRRPGILLGRRRLRGPGLRLRRRRGAPRRSAPSQFWPPRGPSRLGGRSRRPRAGRDRRPRLGLGPSQRLRLTLCQPPQSLAQGPAPPPRRPPLCPPPPPPFPRRTSCSCSARKWPTRIPCSRWIRRKA